MWPFFACLTLLIELILTYYQVGRWKQNSVKFYEKIKKYISRKTMWSWHNKVSATLLRPCRNQWHIRHHPVVCVFWQIGYTCSLRRHQQTCYWLPLSSMRNNELKLTAPPHCWELTIYQKLTIIYAFTLSNIIRSQIWDKIWTKLQYTKCFF